MKIHLSLKSSNAKVGKIPVSTSSEVTCPNSCPMSRKNAGGCYASGGPINIHWKHVTDGNRGMEYKEFYKAIKGLDEGTFWRHNQAGDLYGKGESINANELMKLVKANKGKKGFTYTHKHGLKKNHSLIKVSNELGFTINLSADNVKKADELKALNIAPVVCILPSSVNGNVTKTLMTVGGNKIVVCPAYKENVTCATCQLCSKSNRSVIVGFPAHGVYKKKVSAMSEG